MQEVHDRFHPVDHEQVTPVRQAHFMLESPTASGSFYVGEGEAYAKNGKFETIPHQAT